MERGLNAFERAMDGGDAKLTDESQQVFDGDAHELLIATYQGRYKPSQQQLRAAYKAIEYEKARLQATAILRDESSFAATLDRAIMRSARLINGTATEHSADERRYDAEAEQQVD